MSMTTQYFPISFTTIYSITLGQLADHAPSNTSSAYNKLDLSSFYPNVICDTDWIAIGY